MVVVIKGPWLHWFIIKSSWLFLPWRPWIWQSQWGVLALWTRSSPGFSLCYQNCYLFGRLFHSWNLWYEIHHLFNSQTNVCLFHPELRNRKKGSRSTSNYLKDHESHWLLDHRFFQFHRKNITEAYSGDTFCCFFLFNLGVEFYIWILGGVVELNPHTEFLIPNNYHLFQ